MKQLSMFKTKSGNADFELNEFLNWVKEKEKNNIDHKVVIEELVKEPELLKFVKVIPMYNDLIVGIVLKKYDMYSVYILELIKKIRIKAREINFNKRKI